MVDKRKSSVVWYKWVRMYLVCLDTLWLYRPGRVCWLLCCFLEFIFWKWVAQNFIEEYLSVVSMQKFGNRAIRKKLTNEFSKKLLTNETTLCYNFSIELKWDSYVVIISNQSQTHHASEYWQSLCEPPFTNDDLWCAMSCLSINIKKTAHSDCERSLFLLCFFSVILLFVLLGCFSDIHVLGTHRTIFIVVSCQLKIFITNATSLILLALHTYLIYCFSFHHLSDGVFI